jgi:hypothetical protein
MPAHYKRINDPIDKPEYTGMRNRLGNWIGAKSYLFPDRFEGSLQGGYYQQSKGNPCVTEPIFHKECLEGSR